MQYYTKALRMKIYLCSIRMQGIRAALKGIQLAQKSTRCLQRKIRKLSNLNWVGHTILNCIILLYIYEFVIKKCISPYLESKLSSVFVDLCCVFLGNNITWMLLQEVKGVYADYICSDCQMQKISLLQISFYQPITYLDLKMIIINALHLFLHDLLKEIQKIVLHIRIMLLPSGHLLDLEGFCLVDVIIISNKV